MVHPVGHFLPLVNGGLPFINRLPLANGENVVPDEPDTTEVDKK
jgi:hypothetical protein